MVTLAEKTWGFDQSCLAPNQHISNAFGCLCLVLFDDVRVKTFGGCDACMTKLLGHSNDVGAVGKQDRSYSIIIDPSVQEQAQQSDLLCL